MPLNKPQKTMILCGTFIAGTGAYLLNLIPYLSLILIFLLLYFVYKKNISVKFSVLCLIVLVFSVFYCDFKSPKPDALYKIAPANVYLKGRVVSEPKSNLNNRTKFELQVFSYSLENINQKKIKAKTLVNIYDKEQKYKNILIGDTLEVKGKVKIPFNATNPGQFDYRNYLKNQGIFTLISVKYNDFKIIGHPKFGKWFIIQKSNKIKNKIIDENRKYIESPKLEILEGMVFGDLAVPAPDEIKQEFIKSGLLHLLAASGMNVGFVFGFWIFFATKFRVPYKPKIITGMALIVFYSFLTGFPPSVLRAVFMMEFVLLGKLFDRKADTLILLVVVCALMLLMNPFLLANISFQLSFMTTFGILLCVQPLLDKTKPLPELLSGAVVVPLVAQMWASPVQIYHFNNFSPYSVLANILVVPFVGIITFLGFMGSVFSFIPFLGGKLCWLFDKIAEPFISIILFVSGYVSQLPHALFFIATPEIAGIFIYYGLIIMFLLAIVKNFSSKKINAAIVILFLSLLIFIFKDSFDRKLELVFFDVGQGDAMLVHTPDNKNILVDTGPNGRFIPAKTAIVPYLRKKGITALDAVVLSHSNSDHIGGTLEILKSISVKEIYHNGLNEDTKTCRKLKNYILKNHINNKILYSGQNINLDREVNIKAVRASQNKVVPKDDYENENCIILYISYKGFSSILAADSEADSLYEIKKYVKKQVNIIKIGHHGSSDSVNYTYLNYLKPDLAIISVGEKGYRYGHPNRQVLKELREFNIKTLRTDKDFAITIDSDGKKYNFSTFAGQKH